MDVCLSDIKDLCIVLRQYTHDRGCQSRAILPCNSHEDLLLHSYFGVLLCTMSGKQGVVFLFIICLHIFQWFYFRELYPYSRHKASHTLS